MNLKQYIDDLLYFMADNPGSENNIVCYTTGEEGDNFSENVVLPSLMVYDGIDFMFVDEVKESSHVCIN